MRRKDKFKRRYGISPEQYDEMVKIRQGKCDICERTPSGGGSAGILNIDHVEKDGKIAIRGLLCWQCNVAIGYLKDDTDRLISAIVYLMSNP
jgi:hypothetical protein